MNNIIDFKVWHNNTIADVLDDLKNIAKIGIEYAFNNNLAFDIEPVEFMVPLVAARTK